MPFTPPDPGKLRTIIETVREQTAALEQLAADHHDDALRAEAHVLGLLLSRLEARLPATKSE